MRLLGVKSRSYNWLSDLLPFRVPLLSLWLLGSFLDLWCESPPTFPVLYWFCDLSQVFAWEHINKDEKKDDSRTSLQLRLPKSLFHQLIFNSSPNSSICTNCWVSYRCLPNFKQTISAHKKINWNNITIRKKHAERAATAFKGNNTVSVENVIPVNVVYRDTII